MGIYIFFTAAIMVAITLIVIASTFDSLTVTFIRKSRSSSPKKNRPPKEKPLPVPEAAPEKRGPVLNKKISDEQQSYRELFLERPPGAAGRQTGIDRDIYGRIDRFLPVIAPQMKIREYIDNIVEHHLEQYRDEIDDLYEVESYRSL